MVDKIQFFVFFLLKRMKNPHSKRLINKFKKKIETKLINILFECFSNSNLYHALFI
jgi:hypothetical protein